MFGAPFVAQNHPGLPQLLWEAFEQLMLGTLPQGSSQPRHANPLEIKKRSTVSQVESEINGYI